MIGRSGFKRYLPGVLVCGLIGLVVLATLFVWFVKHYPAKLPVEALADKARYEEVCDAVSRERLAQSIRFLASQKTRIPGSPGNAAATEYIERRLHDLGLDVVKWPFKVLTPRTLEARIDIVSAHEAFPEVEVFPMWANVVRTCTLEEPVSARVVFAPRGEAPEMKGRDIEGAVVAQLSGDWQTAAMLGARAILYLDPEGNDVPWEDTAAAVAVDMPRFLVRTKDRSVRGAELGKLLDGRLIRLACQVELVEEEAYNLLARVGPDPTETPVGNLPKGCLILSANFDSTSSVPDLAPGFRNPRSPFIVGSHWRTDRGSCAKDGPTAAVTPTPRRQFPARPDNGPFCRSPPGLKIARTVPEERPLRRSTDRR